MNNNPDDLEDVLIVLAYALGGANAEIAGSFGMKVGGNLTRYGIKNYIKRDVLKAIQKLGKAIGVKILQKTLIKYSIPIVSIGIGGGEFHFNKGNRKDSG